VGVPQCPAPAPIARRVEDGVDRIAAPPRRFDDLLIAATV
jgi:hypothetical protein